LESTLTTLTFSINGVEDLDDVQAADKDKGSATETQSRVIDVEFVVVVPNIDEKVRRKMVEIKSENS